MILIGGMAFYYLVLVPGQDATRGPDPAALIGKIERRFRNLRWISLLVLLGTGIANLIREGDSPRMVSGYGGLLLLKLLLVGVFSALMGIHDFGRGGPAAGPQSESRPSRDALWRRLGVLTFLLGIVIVLLTVYLAQM